jgi:hypothetical protein
MIDAWEMRIELSRNIQENDVEEIQEQLMKIQTICKDLSEDAFEEKQKDLTIKQFADYLSLAHSAYLLNVYGDCYLKDYMFLLWLQERNIKYRVISEFDLDKDRGKNYISIT